MLKCQDPSLVRYGHRRQGIAYSSQHRETEYFSGRLCVCYPNQEGSLPACGDEPERAIVAVNKSRTDWKVEHTTDALKAIRREWVKIQDAEYN